MGKIRLFLLSCLLMSLLVSPGAGQRPRRGAEDFPRPENFFEMFFNGPNEQDEQALSAIEISKQEEKRFGDQMVAAYLDSLRRERIKVVRRGKDVDYLRQLVAAIHPLMRNADRYPTIEVSVVDSPLADARSFPNGSLFFYRGMLELVDNEAALVGVIGHELSHLDNGHQLVPLKQSKLMEKTFTQTGRRFDPQQFFAAGTSMMRMMSRPFRPQDEAEADTDGVEWAYRAGYDPRELGKLFVRMHEQNRAIENVPFAAFFRTHPLSLDRSDAVFRQYDELQERMPREDLYLGTENLKRRIPRSESEFPE